MTCLTNPLPSTPAPWVFRYIYVCNYLPAGNVAGQYAANVQVPATP